MLVETGQVDGIQLKLLDGDETDWREVGVAEDGLDTGPDLGFGILVRISFTSSLSSKFFQRSYNAKIF